MKSFKENIIDVSNRYIDELFDIACDIFDHPEIGLEETYAASLLTSYLEKKGFSVEKGIAGISTAFRAVWEKGSGGPAIGFLVEYDALAIMGHGCAHHLQPSACFGAALALMETCDEPFKIVIYGTPDEEKNGGKITMEKAGCFRDVDAMFAYHAGGITSVSYTNRALISHLVTFHGTPSHASAAPEKGRSALDAMLLTFQGIEFMREHIKDGCRMQYTILEGTGATNIVHETAKARITLRSHDRYYLEHLQGRLKKIIDGACLMTETTADIEPLSTYWNLVPVDTFLEVVLSAEEEMEAKNLHKVPTAGGGSTDVGNVSWVVPTANMSVYFSEGGAHSETWIKEGKSEKARYSVLTAAQILALAATKLIQDPALLEKIKQEHKEAITKTEE